MADPHPLALAAALFGALVAGMAASALLVRRPSPGAFALRLLLVHLPWLALAHLLAFPQLAAALRPPAGALPFLWWSGYMAVGLMAALGIAYAAGRLLRWGPPAHGKLRPFFRGRGAPLVIPPAAALAGALEELLFRGLIAVLLFQAMDFWPAVLAQAALFGLLHLYQGRTGVVQTALAGVAFGIVTLMSGSIWPAVAAHALLNAIGTLALIRRLR